ncbi:MAG: AarF/ABC1/UbiB kinase family protein, partial [Alcanivorax sp.]|nr:AarF/ABC1/UbiB kinase family protein [Alcanivorax sp.]
MNLLKQSASGVSGLAAGRSRYLRALSAGARLTALYARHYRAGKGYNRAHQRGAELLCRLCERNGATWVKAAQFFSCRPDVLPPAYIQAFQRLQNDGTPVPFSQIEKVLAQAWGESWREQFEVIDAVPVAVASIAQVHRATLADGTEVAIKVRLPGVRKLFEQDGKVFEAVAALLAPRFREFDLKQAVDQLLQMTATELDLRNEAANMQRFARLPHQSRIRVPGLVESLSSERVLVTVWQDGDRLRDYLDSNPDEAQDLLSVLLTSYLQQVTRFGIYQADPHPGNFLVTQDKQIVILDYGAIGMLTADEVRRYSRLLYGLMGFEGEVDIGEADIGEGGEDLSSEGGGVLHALGLG